MIVVPLASVAAIPTASLLSLVPPISGYLVGCPTRTIADTVRTMAIDLCQRGKVWTVDAGTVYTAAGEYEYLLTFPDAYYEPTDVTSGILVKADGSKVVLKYMAPSALRAARRSWPEADSGSPVAMTSAYPGSVQFAPVPEGSEQIRLRVVVRPTPDAEVIPQWIASEFQRELFHGTLHHLMLMPNRTWTNDKLAMYHGKQWTHLLSAAKFRAASEYNSGSLSVEMRPFA